MIPATEKSNNSKIEQKKILIASGYGGYKLKLLTIENEDKSSNIIEIIVNSIVNTI